MGVIYLIKTREFVNSEQNIFKIGKSSKPGANRTSQYPKGSILYFLITVSNEDLIEHKIIELFSKEFIHKKEYGNEYFEGEYNEIITSMLKIINEVGKCSDNKVKCESDINDDIKLDNDEFKCEYCLHTFSNSFNKTRHICKHKEDPVRLLEIALKINIVLPTCSTECRFCHKMLSKTATLTKHTLICQSRKDYQQELYQRKIKKDEINVIIDYKEPPKNGHIKKETLQGILTEVDRTNKNRPEIAGGSGVAMYANEIYKNPENRNVKVYQKSAIAKGFIDNCWVEMLKSNVIKEKFLSICTSMYQQISDY